MILKSKTLSFFRLVGIPAAVQALSALYDQSETQQKAPPTAKIIK